LSCLQLLSASLQPLSVEDCCEEADVDVEGESISGGEVPRHRPGKGADVDADEESIVCDSTSGSSMPFLPFPVSMSK